MRSEDFAMTRTKSEVVLASTPCRFVRRHWPVGERRLHIYGGSTTLHFCPGDWGTRFLQNVRNHLHNWTVSSPRRPQILEVTTLWTSLVAFTVHRKPTAKAAFNRKTLFSSKLDLKLNEETSAMLHLEHSFVWHETWTVRKVDQKYLERSEV